MNIFYAAGYPPLKVGKGLFRQLPRKIHKNKNTQNRNK